MTEFKQIIGRGTRVREEYGKLHFTILDYTGSATQHFADPEFDGDPELIKEQKIDAEGNVLEETTMFMDVDDDEWDEEIVGETSPEILTDDDDDEPRKYYVNGEPVEIVHELVYQLDAYGKRLNVIEYTDYTTNVVQKLYPTAARFRECWSDPVLRGQVLTLLQGHGIDFQQLADSLKQPDADPFDLLCHLAYNAPLRTRRERAELLRRDKKDFFSRYGPQARAILHELLQKYAEHGTAQFTIPDVLKVSPISEFGNISEIIRFFGGADELKQAVDELQSLLYAA